MDFIRSTSEKVKLWRVEHFFPPFFSRSVLIGGKFIFYKKIHYKICKCCNFNQSALIWKKTGEKSVQLVRVSLFRKYFLWNPYFRRNNGNFIFFKYLTANLLFFPFFADEQVRLDCGTRPPASTLFSGLWWGHHGVKHIIGQLSTWWWLLELVRCPPRGTWQTMATFTTTTKGGEDRDIQVGSSSNEWGGRGDSNLQWWWESLLWVIHFNSTTRWLPS